MKMRLSEEDGEKKLFYRSLSLIVVRIDLEFPEPYLKMYNN